MTNAIPPQWLAGFDQHRAETAQKLDTIAVAFRQCTTEQGGNTTQAFGVLAMLAKAWEHEVTCELLAEAVARIAQTEPATP